MFLSLKTFVSTLSLGAQTIQMVAKYILVQYYFIFSLEPSSFLTEKLWKQTELKTRDQSLFRLQNKFRKDLLLVIYYLTKFDNAT